MTAMQLLTLAFCVAAATATGLQACQYLPPAEQQQQPQQIQQQPQQLQQQPQQFQTQPQQQQFQSWQQPAQTPAVQQPQQYQQQQQSFSSQPQQQPAYAPAQQLLTPFNQIAQTQKEQPQQQYQWPQTQQSAFNQPKQPQQQLQSQYTPFSQKVQSQQPLQQQIQPQQKPQLQDKTQSLQKPQQAQQLGGSSGGSSAGTTLGRKCYIRNVLAHPDDYLEFTPGDSQAVTSFKRSSAAVDRSGQWKIERFMVNGKPLFEFSNVAQGKYLSHGVNFQTQQVGVLASRANFAYNKEQRNLWEINPPALNRIVTIRHSRTGGYLYAPKGALSKRTVQLGSRPNSGTEYKWFITCK